MSDMVEKAKNNVHDVKWELEKIRSMAIHNQDAVERVHHYTVATYDVIKTKKNEKLSVIATDAINEYNLARAYINQALEYLDKCKHHLEEWEKVESEKEVKSNEEKHE